MLSRLRTTVLAVAALCILSLFPRPASAAPTEQWYGYGWYPYYAAAYYTPLTYYYQPLPSLTSYYGYRAALCWSVMYC